MLHSDLRLKSTMAQRIYEAQAVTMPFSVPGEMRVAAAEDRPMLEDWNLRYAQDCGLDLDRERAGRAAEDAIKNKSRNLWIVDGKAVSMAGVGGPTPSGIRISWVYTPSALRGKGYASALVASLTQKMLSQGHRFCFLYTDLANPTSNSIYQKIGYRPVCDSAHHIFE